MDRRRDNERGRNDFNRNAESFYREHLQNDPRFGGGWAHDWDSNPNSGNGAYRGGPRNIHWSDDRDYSNREGHGYYADDNSGTVYGGGNRGRGDYGRSSAYGRRGYYDRGTYFEDAGRYTPRFHERREYDEYDRREDLNGRSRDTHMPASARMHSDRQFGGGRREENRRDGWQDESRRNGNDDRDRRGDAFSARERDGYDPRQERLQSGPRGDRSSDRFEDREYDDRFGFNYRSENDHQHWYQGSMNEDRRNNRSDRRERDERRGFTPGDMGGQYGARNTW